MLGFIHCKVSFNDGHGVDTTFMLDCTHTYILALDSFKDVKHALWAYRLSAQVEYGKTLYFVQNESAVHIL